jgi:hypothetical protein
VIPARTCARFEFSWMHWDVHLRVSMRESEPFSSRDASIYVFKARLDPRSRPLYAIGLAIVR